MSTNQENDISPIEVLRELVDDVDAAGGLDADDLLVGAPEWTDLRNTYKKALTVLAQHEDLGARLYKTISQDREKELPPLPSGWLYTYTSGSGGVGIVHEMTQIEIWATPGWEQDSACSTAVEVWYPGRGGNCTWIENWELPEATIQRWFELLFNLAGRVSTREVILHARIENRNSPARGDYHVAVTPFGDFIIEFGHTLLRSSWVYFHTDDQFAKVVEPPQPFN